MALKQNEAAAPLMQNEAARGTKRPGR